MSNKIIKIYDTTLRDGMQAEDIAFSLEDTIRIAEKLDSLGVHYIEGGWPGSNPRDAQFFKEMENHPLKNAQLVAFGSTRRAKNSVEDDLNIKALIETKTEVITIFGKSWDLHVKDALRITLEKNLELISDSIRYLKTKVSEVMYDAEHFFDGFKNNPDYALKTIEVAQDAGADWIVLCDTNGGIDPLELWKIMDEVKKRIDTPLGIHVHNDSEMAVANSIIAVARGAELVQGTINGYGERCGNANLCSLIPNIKLKLGLDCISDNNMAKLREVSRFVNEIANLPHWKHQPYVGESAFAHKGGIHVSAVQRNPETYEHIKPELVGNHQRILVSDLAGRSNILYKAAEFNIDLKSEDEVVHTILENLKDLEKQGFQFEGAEASFELLMKRAVGKYKKFFELKGTRVIVEKRKEAESPISEATIKVKVGEEIEHTAAEGNGPVNALDNALRKALEKFYPSLKSIELLDYKVRVLSTGEGTEANVRVLIESGDGENRWGTVGVSPNIIEASWQALVDSIEYKLLKEEEKKDI